MSTFEVGRRWPPPKGGTWIIDLDGVIWLSGEPILGVDEAISSLNRLGVRTVFVTNNSSLRHVDLVQRLAYCGIDGKGLDVLSSVDALAYLIRKGSRVLAIAGDGVYEALSTIEVQVVTEGAIDVVLIGWTRQFSYEHLTQAMIAIRNGARLIGTNQDPTYPTPNGLLPGTGSLLAAVATASGVLPEIAGKPHEATVRMLRERIEDIRLVVGDRPGTDGALASKLGVPYALVLSGVTKESDVSNNPIPDVVAKDLAELVEMFARQ